MAAFESYMEDCMVRDWAANKRQLFGLIAPHSGAAFGGGGGGGGGMQFGMSPLARASGTGVTPHAHAGGSRRGLQGELKLSVGAHGASPSRMHAG